MFTYVQHTHTEARTILGGSWLYHLEAYRRLFPPVYGESRVVQEGTAHLQGTASWGQFLDHREAVKPALREHFQIERAEREVQDVARPRDLQRARDGLVRHGADDCAG